MIPLRDRNPTRGTPFVTWGLIGACIAAFAIELSITASSGDRGLAAFFREWGAVPADITRALEAGTYLGQATLGMFTSMFLHGGWLHLLGNMLFLWIFGNNVEDRLGPVPFLLFYLVGGVAAVLAQVVIDPSSTIPLVGASGAIAAALGAYIVLFPGARILSLVFLGFFYQLIEIPAVIVLGVWFALQLVNGFAGFDATTAQGGVAFFAHVGGFVFGLGVGVLLRVVEGGTGRERLGFGPMG
jgi:membrane associated rhomboid family serine protease